MTFICRVLYSLVPGAVGDAGKEPPCKEMVHFQKPSARHREVLLRLLVLGTGDVPAYQIGALCQAASQRVNVPAWMFLTRCERQ